MTLSEAAPTLRDMEDEMNFDVNFDFRSDTPPGKDPDTYSPTLRRYHQKLWGRNLPDGRPFDLQATNPKRYLEHHSDAGDFILSSDSVIHTYSYWVRMEKIIKQVPESEIEDFRRVGYTIGGMMIWPGVPVRPRRTINTVRGTTSSIADRMDLTLECVRRYYLGEDSPLLEILSDYEKFFALFTNFDGFVEHFLLQDLVDESGNGVRFFLPFDGTWGKATPADVDEYRTYKAKSIDFVKARNRRIAELVDSMS